MNTKRDNQKLPNKETLAKKLINPGNSCLGGMICIFQGEEVVLRQATYGSFKKLIQAAIKLQKSDPHFTWRYLDTLPDPTVE